MKTNIKADMLLILTISNLLHYFTVHVIWNKKKKTKKKELCDKSNGKLNQKNSLKGTWLCCVWCRSPASTNSRYSISSLVLLCMDVFVLHQSGSHLYISPSSSPPSQRYTHVMQEMCGANKLLCVSLWWLRLRVLLKEETAEDVFTLR